MPQPEVSPADHRRAMIVSVVGAVLLAAALVVVLVVPMFRKKVAAAPVFDAHWVGLPTPKEVIDAYPAKAREAKITGDIKVEMHCQVAEQGAVTGCTIASESPASYGFGDAALALAPKFRLKATSADGSSLVGLPIVIPIRFEAE